MEEKKKIWFRVFVI